MKKKKKKHKIDLSHAMYKSPYKELGMERFSIGGDINKAIRKDKMKSKKKPDYKGFVEHVNKLRNYGISDLIRIAKIYGTPIPKKLSRRVG